MKKNHTQNLAIYIPNDISQNNIQSIINQSFFSFTHFKIEIKTVFNKTNTWNNHRFRLEWIHRTWFITEKIQQFNNKNLIQYVVHIQIQYILRYHHPQPGMLVVLLLTD